MRFYVPTDLRIGADVVSASAEEIAALGERCLVLTGAVSAKKSGALQNLCAVLDDMEVICFVANKATNTSNPEDYFPLPVINVCKSTMSYK